MMDASETEMVHNPQDIGAFLLSLKKKEKSYYKLLENKIASTHNIMINFLYRYPEYILNMLMHGISNNTTHDLNVRKRKIVAPY